MKKTLFILMLVLFSISSMGFNAATLRENSVDYTKQVHKDTKWCEETHVVSMGYQGGRIHFGCDKDDINEVITWFKRDTSRSYKAKSLKDDTWYYGPKKSHNNWSKEEVVLRGRNGSGIKIYN